MNFLWPRPFLVLGMHRSGTSAVAGCLEKLGVSMGDHLLAGDAWNPRGYFEDSKLVALNERLLNARGIRWDSLDDGLLPEVLEQEKIAEEITHWALAAFGSKDTPWGLKDPRISRLNDFWLPWFQAMALSPRIVLVLRNPREIAYSLKRRDGISVERSVWLWIRHMDGALQLASQSPDATWLDFTQLSRNPEGEVQRLSQSLGLKLESSNQTTFRDFVDVRHVHSPSEDFPPIPQWASSAHELLLAAVRGGQSMKELMLSSDWMKLKEQIRPEHEAVKHFTSLLYGHDKQLNRMEQHIRALRTGLEHAELISSTRTDEVNSLTEQLKITQRALDNATIFSMKSAESLETLRKQITTYERALSRSEEIAISRLDELSLLNNELHRTQVAQKNAESLVRLRETDLKAMDTRIRHYEGALAKTERLARARLDQLVSLSEELGKTQVALNHAENLAHERYQSIQNLNRQLITTEQALADAEKLAFERMSKAIESPNDPFSQ